LTTTASSPLNSNPYTPTTPTPHTPHPAIAGGYHNILIFDDRSIVVWGNNYFGQLGLGDNRRRIYPVLLDYFRAKFVAAPNLSPRDGAGGDLSSCLIYV